MTPLTKQAVEEATGRALDALVHVHVMGLPEDKMLMEFPTITPEPDGSTGLAEWMNYARAYSADGNAMLAVLEKMRGQGFDYTLLNCRYAGEPIARHVCTFYWDKPNQQYRQFDGRGNSAPEAVCRAALLAIAQREEAA